MINELMTFSQYVKHKYNSDAWTHFDKRSGVRHLDHLVVPKGERKIGTGTKIMNDLTKIADNNKTKLALNTAVKDDHMGTTSGERLKRFYSRFGFVRNKGMKKDFTLSANMYRKPQ